jgi:tryptophan synthase alpha chain
MNGIKHITQAFEGAHAQGRAALMPYFTLGYPTPQASMDVIETLAHSGADLIELGIPFSDPLADGPTIQRSTQVALQQGMTVARCLEMLQELRQRGVAQPLLLMGYINPLLSFGISRFIAEAARLGADGLILPDLPVEEAGEVEACCQEHGLALVYLLAPTSTKERIAMLARHSTGFLYLVSITGVTGARSSLPPDLQDFVKRVRAHTSLPLAVGFGIATPEQARQVGEIADGVIIGSALINAVAQSTDPASAAGDYLGNIHQAFVPLVEDV